MERETPIITIHGTEFGVDVNRALLFEKDDPGNSISFIHNMQDKGDHYELLYNIYTKSYHRNPDDYGANEVNLIRIPTMAELDPHGMAEKYGVKIAGLKGKTDFELMVDPELLAERLSGKLPKIDIAGHPFIIDYRLKELRPENNPGAKIDLKALDLNEKTGDYVTLYHPGTQSVISSDCDISKLSEGLVIVTIPNQLKLDPVAVADEFGMAQKDLLRLHPIQKELKAEVSPITKPMLANLKRWHKNPETPTERQQQKNRRKNRMRR